jgi:hypothetical protein
MMALTPDGAGSALPAIPYVAVSEAGAVRTSSFMHASDDWQRA